VFRSPPSCADVPFFQLTPRRIRPSTASWRHFPSSTLFLVRVPRGFEALVLTASKVLGFLLLLLFLAWRHHSHGERAVWTTPVTSFPWFHSSQDALNEKEGKLPPPVTAPVDRSRSKGAGALNPAKGKHQQQRAKPQDLGKIRTTGLTPPPKNRQPSYEYRHGYWLPTSADAPPAPAPPPKATVSRTNTRDRQSSRDRSREGGRTQERGRRHRSTTRDRSLQRGNSGSKRPAAGPGQASRDRYYRDASPRR